MKPRALNRLISFRGKGGSKGGHRHADHHDDDSLASSSVASTCTRSPPNHKKRCIVFVQQQPVVCFDERSNCYYYESSPLSDDELHQRWYDAQEIQQMKETFYNAAANLKNTVKAGVAARDDETCVAIVSHVYRTCCCSSSSISSSHERRQQDHHGSGGKRHSHKAVLQVQELLAQHQDEIPEWSCAWTGMEHLLDKKLRQEKKKRREELVHLVYNLPYQRQQQQQYACSNNSSVVSDHDDLAEVLREQCQQVSKPARTFALCIAHVRRIEH